MADKNNSTLTTYKLSELSRECFVNQWIFNNKNTPASILLSVKLHIRKQAQEYFYFCNARKWATNPFLVLMNNPILLTEHVHTKASRHWERTELKCKYSQNNLRNQIKNENTILDTQPPDIVGWRIKTSQSTQHCAIKSRQSIEY